MTSSSLETNDEHLRNLEMMLQRLLDARLRAHPAKTRFFDAKTEYCSHAVSADGLHQLPAKVDAIRDAPQPTNVSQLRSFLGLVNYYARFLPNLSTTLHPLNRLQQHNIPFHWTDACTAAFDKVKRQIGSDLVLTHFHPDLLLHVASDASPYGLGAVLSHSMPDGTERPIAQSRITARLTRKPLVPQAPFHFTHATLQVSLYASSSGGTSSIATFFTTSPCSYMPKPS